jgi:hypothetical protein
MLRTTLRVKVAAFDAGRDGETWVQNLWYQSVTVIDRVPDITIPPSNTTKDRHENVELVGRPKSRPT